MLPQFQTVINIIQVKLWNYTNVEFTIISYISCHHTHIIFVRTEMYFVTYLLITVTGIRQLHYCMFSL